jgi:hypothetical protein
VNTWLKTGALVIGLWLVIAIVVHFARASQPTAESVTAYAQSVNISTLQGDQRAKAIGKMEDMINRVSADDRRQLDRAHVSRQFFDQLSEDEKLAYLDATLPTGFEQMMDSFNKMDSAQRQRIVRHALDQMQKQQDDGPPPGEDEKMQQHIVDQGLKSFYKDASADTKLDLAPLVDQIQSNLENHEVPQ